MHQSNFPNLKFKDENGNDYHDWELINGDELFESISNKKHNSDLPILAITQDKGAIPRHLINYDITVSSKSISGYKVVRKGDFIISLRSFQGGIEYSNYEGICSPAYIILRPIKRISRQMFKYYFKSYNFIQQLNRKLEGIRDGKMISYKYFSEIKLPFPAFDEQIKIASFLSAVDSKIEKLTIKKELLEKYKRGVMQKLFSGEIRFKDENGNNYPDWKKVKLGDIASVKRGAGSQYIEYSEKNEDSIRLIRISDFLEDKPVFIKKSKAINRFILEDGDILIAGTGATAGITFLVPKNFVGLAFSYNAPKIKVFEDDVTFVYYFLISEEIIRQQKRLFTGNAQPFLDTKSMKNFKISLPSKSEQVKIASFLTLFDFKIDSLSSQIEKMKEYKKGLLQQMFV
jgi:type I restriction enzyme S subunit